MSQSNSSTFVATDTPARYIARLCKHFAHKLPVSFDAEQGCIQFASGRALLQAEVDGLTLRVQAADAGEREKLEQVVARHFERFAWREQLSLDWR